MSGVPANVIRLVASGALPGGDIWTSGFWLNNITTPVQADTDAAAASLAVNWKTMWLAIANQLYEGATFTKATAYGYAVTGGPAAVTSEVPVTGAVGNIDSGGSPVDTCAVASLRTAQPGRSFRGRMYLPYHSSVGADTGQLGSGDCSLRSGAAAAMLTQTATDTGTVPSVISVVRSVSTAITYVSVDSIPDVQRRRENKLVAITNSIAAV
uniref:Uncharacterized protein n=1 Tax=uncultured prokaryote TaxID=198431 RepID=A0A0H5Q5Q8_9ZZZZ|nr:hypothetical protein [uncultured prokaryote]